MKVEIAEQLRYEWWLSLILPLVAMMGCSPQSSDEKSAPASVSPSIEATWTMLEVPAEQAALAPELTWSENGLLMTWLEPWTLEEAEGHRLRYARLVDDRWGSPQTVIEGSGFFANWADRPQLLAAPGQDALIAWLEKLGEDTYAYGIQLATAAQLGEGPWVRRGLLHDDASASEHGFVTWLAADDGIHGFWLDGRRMPSGGDMQLRTVFLPSDRWHDPALTSVDPAESTLLDERVCECCATDSAMTAKGPVIVYRDRGPEEIRNISIVRWLDDVWTPPQEIHQDGWKIQGCPVNGPAVVAEGSQVAVAWFTVVGGRSQVRLAFSEDAGASFAVPIVLDDAEPLGRLDLVLQNATEVSGSKSVWVSWLAKDAEGAQIRVQQVFADGRRDPPMTVAQVSGQRSVGVPRLAGDDGRLYVAWREDGDAAGLRSAVFGSR